MALREVLHRYLPPKLTDRPKMGFSVPVGEWLCGPIGDWAEDLLGEARLREEGVLHPAPIRRLWAEHLSGRRNAHRQLWAVIMFQAWLATTKDGVAAQRPAEVCPTAE